MSLPPTPIAACLLFAAASVAAQPQVQTKTDGRWRGSLGAALALASETDSQTLALNADLARATPAHKLTLRGSANQGRSKVDGVRRTDSSKWAATGQLDITLTPRLYAFANAGLAADRLVALTLRSSGAGGLGYKLIDTPTLGFAVFGGAGLTSDAYSRPQTIAGRTATRFTRANLRLGEDLAWQLSDTTRLKHGLEIAPGLSGDKATLAKAHATLAVAMSRTLSLTVGLTMDYNSEPPAGRESNDLGLFTGLNIAFGDV